MFDVEAPGPRDVEEDEEVGHVQPSAPVKPNDSFSYTTETTMYTDTVSVFWNVPSVSQSRRYPVRSFTTTTIGTFMD